MSYKYPHTQKFFDSLSSKNSVEEMHELLVMSVEFLDLGLGKTKIEHLMPSFDNLLTMLEEGCPSSWEVLSSLSSI